MFSECIVSSVLCVLSRLTTKYRLLPGTSELVRYSDLTGDSKALTRADDCDRSTFRALVLWGERRAVGFPQNTYLVAK